MRRILSRELRFQCFYKSAGNIFVYAAEAAREPARLALYLDPLVENPSTTRALATSSTG